MKKLIALALISMLCISLCSCIYNEVTFDDTDSAQATDDATETGGTQNDNTTDPSDTNPSETDPANTDPSETEGSTDTDGNTTETQKPSNDNEWTNNY